MTTYQPGPVRSPAIFVGAGGTGIKTLRFMLSTLQTSQDPVLQRMLREGEFQFIGIDTDPGSNKPDQGFDPNMVPDPQDPEKAKQLPFRHLAALDNFILIKADDISRALMAIRLDLRKQQGRDGTNPGADQEALQHQPGHTQNQTGAHTWRHGALPPWCEWTRVYYLSCCYPQTWSGAASVYSAQGNAHAVPDLPAR